MILQERMGPPSPFPIDKTPFFVYNYIVRQFEQETKEPIHGSTVIGSDAYEEFLRC